MMFDTAPWWMHALWLASPAFAANLAPPVLNKLFPKLNYPMDFGTNVLGTNKTWRGFIGGSAVGGLIGFLLGLNILYSFAIATAALAGDALSSLAKRRFKLAPGAPCWGLDQLDYIVAFLAISLIWVEWRWNEVLLIILVGGFGSTICNVAAHKMGLKNKPW